MKSARDPNPDKHVVAAQAMRQHSRVRPSPQSNLSDLKIQKVTRQSHLALVLMPKWAVLFAPYNLARLAAVSRAAGYRTTVFDWNVDSWVRTKKKLDWAWGGGDSSEMDHAWVDDAFHSRVKPLLRDTLSAYADELVALKPDVVGFSLYQTNMEATLWMVEQLRSRLPGAILVGGGSQAQSEAWREYPQFDCMVQGEGEEALLEILERVESGQPIPRGRLMADKSKRLNLDMLPYPDYSDLYKNQYFLPNAAATEISRGCVAKCTFCAETWFWKYRNRRAESLLDEIEHQYRAFGINTFHFIDSLVNGNLEELRSFATGVAERKLEIWWYGYARCNSRMDLAYFQDLKNSGCHGLNFGIESGSQRVLDLMKKNIRVDEIETNLRDSTAVGLRNYSQWLLGFPGETIDDLAKTMTLAWRVQDLNLESYARGTMNLSPCTVTENKDRFGVSGNYFLDQWMTLDQKNTKLHRMVRQKIFNILIDRIHGNHDPSHRTDLRRDYELETDTTDCRRDIPYEDFDYDLIRVNTLGADDFTNSLLNEPWPLFRLMWKAYGSLKLSLLFDPVRDLAEYGPRLAGCYRARYDFAIDRDGRWTMKVSAKLVTPPFVWSGPTDLRSDYSFEQEWTGQGQWEPVSQLSNG